MDKIDGRIRDSEGSTQRDAASINHCLDGNKDISVPTTLHVNMPSPLSKQFLELKNGSYLNLMNNEVYILKERNGTKRVPIAKCVTKDLSGSIGIQSARLSPSLQANYSYRVPAPKGTTVNHNNEKSINS